MRSNEQLLQTFWDRVSVNPRTKCWDWIGSKNKDGYGNFWDGKNQLRSHKLSYELLIQAVPNGMTLDHLCRNRSCVNPEHLEIVTWKENIHRGVGIASLNSKKTHCKRGHEFTTDNTYIATDGSRKCRECNKIKCRNQRLMRCVS